MSNKNKKRQREEAIKAEILKREIQRAEKSPINQDQMLSLIEFVGKNIIDNGHEHDFEFTKKWVKINQISIESLIKFLNGEHIKDDWDLCVTADPFHLFGTTNKRLSWMPLERTELEALLDWLDTTLPKKGCKHDYSLTKKWLSENSSADISTTLMALMAKGGGCDCEIVYNVEEENIYP